MIATAIFVLSFCWGVYGRVAEPPQSFEAASLKLSPPVDPRNARLVGCSGGPGTADPGLYTCRWATLQGLLIEGFDLKLDQLPYSPSGDHSSYDLVARVPPGTSREPFRLMVQDLLAERLKLVFHYEKREVQVYDLKIADRGPKLKESQSELAAEPKAGGGNQPPSAANPTFDEYGFPALPATFRGTMMTYRNGVAQWVARGATMDQWVGDLTRRLGRPVTDLTGLKGKYDFTLYFSAASVGVQEPVNPSRVASPSAAGLIVPEGDLPTIFGVLQSELGLKLAPKKGAIDFLVIDHAEKTPVEN
jgi:uncharacterized protein (TIGR03435 family)